MIKNKQPHHGFNWIVAVVACGISTSMHAQAVWEAREQRPIEVGGG